MKKWLSTVLLAIILFSSRSVTLTDSIKIIINDTLQVSSTLLYSDNFNSGFDNWIPEHEKEMHLSVVNGVLEIDAPGGSTTWFKEKLAAPLMIEYDAVVVDDGGANDRVSDLNCFWLAKDPENPDDFFCKSEERSGIFGNYDALQLYYVGLGGHNNTRTRFRRYEGTGEKPLLPEHDLTDEKYLIAPNVVNRIRIVVYGGIVQYYRNDRLIIDFYDQNPYDRGYFGIRTVRNHLTIDNFKVYSLSLK